jgi:hypothetical protein
MVVFCMPLNTFWQLHARLEVFSLDPANSNYSLQFQLFGYAAANGVLLLQFPQFVYYFRNLCKNNNKKKKKTLRSKIVHYDRELLA